MYNIIHRTRERIRKSVLRDLRREPVVERFSLRVWPWREAWLTRCVALLAVLDFLSTYALLELSHKRYVYESGPMARSALETGGFQALLVADFLAVGILCLLAVGARIAYSRFGYHGYARAAYVATLLPYVAVASFATVNNLVLTIV
ncbi:MAG: hypothetical protein Q7K03_11825 [Dehalococcoidia bacterium]|nr:hypothetical protein [Dehalococcoidia bacterium]